jgi:dihydroorotase-like cyclic amidohydrolase
MTMSYWFQMQRSAIVLKNEDTMMALKKEDKKNEKPKAEDDGLARGKVYILKRQQAANGGELKQVLRMVNLQKLSVQSLNLMILSLPVTR